MNTLYAQGPRLTRRKREGGLRDGWPRTLGLYLGTLHQRPRRNK